MIHTTIQIDGAAEIRADWNEDSKKVEVRAFDPTGTASLMIEMTLDQFNTLRDTK